MDTLSDIPDTNYKLPLSEADQAARPGSAEISGADAYIFGLVRQAAACRETAAWTFHVAGPDGTREMTEHEDPPPS